MPMLTPLVWCIDAPPDAFRGADVSEACDWVLRGRRVCLPDLEAAIEVLGLLGATSEWARYCALKASQQPISPTPVVPFRHGNSIAVEDGLHWTQCECGTQFLCEPRTYFLVKELMLLEGHTTRGDA